MMKNRSCPALFISAPASHQGKTTVTAALARYHATQGRAVRVFKCGPDFLDPLILERASGAPVYQLDLWMGGEAHCRRLLYEAAAEADLILIEGVMGLFDGNPSSADLAQLTGVPVLAVIDANAMAQTFAAIAYGLAYFRENLPFHGVLANQVAGERHADLLYEGLPTGLTCWGSLSRDAGFALPDRHLGLVQAEEVGDLERRLAAAAEALSKTRLTQMPPPAQFACPEPQPPAPPRLLAGQRIGIARDRAFSFLYPANLDLLRAMGAELVFFSPLADTALPEVESLYLPGGYPELHLGQLSANRALAEALHRHVEAGKPLYAECGGMLYLLESLSDTQGHCADMVGLLPGHALMQERLMALGYQSAPLSGGLLRGHTFHHSKMQTPLTPVACGDRLHSPSTGEAIYQLKRLVASYLHTYFPSDPLAAARLFLP